MVVVFWSSTCTICAAEVPLLKQLYWKYQDRGVTLIGVSLDADRSTAARTVTRDGLFWPQICDGKEDKGEIARLCNI